ncbi:MAG: 30S ribosomal protein S1, partial [Planctomycetota bacterium]|nr:30S ribosomal protein S1 [Planctomycetota bacterium]
MALTSRRVKAFELDAEVLDAEVEDILGGFSAEALNEELNKTIRSIPIDSIVKATVDTVDERTGLVVLDVGGKSEGTIPLSEFGEELPVKGEVFDVYYSGLDETDTAMLSKRRADRLAAWETVSQKYNEGDEVQGEVQRKIKGGLLVDVEGVNVFLPASQVNLRRTHDISEFIGEAVRARIIKIDPERMNIVVSRRKLLEEERAEKRESLMEKLEEKQVRMGTVKNIADFGAFVDLGGIDGLLHITDMSWGRLKHPSEMVAIGDELEVMVLRVDRDRERIALGIKQKSQSPWDGIEERYAVGNKVKGNVVNIMSYGAFVKLEDGVEGLVHISEMSWTRRINHPSELLTQAEEVEVVVLALDLEKQEISLGMKQAEANPWDLAQEHYPQGTIIEGRVRNLTTYGAFVEIEEGIDGLLHVSDMSWTKKVAHPSEVVKKGDKLTCVVLSVDVDKRRIALGLKQLTPDPWMDSIPNNYHVGDLLSGHATKITNFGVFVKLEDDLEGLLHVSELADHKIESPEDVVALGMKIEVRVIRVDLDERKIGLSFVHADFPENEEFAKKAAKAVKEVAEPESLTGTGIDLMVALGDTKLKEAP